MFVGIYFVFCALSSLQLTNGAVTKTNGDSSIVFPGPTQDVSNRHGTVDVPDKCKGKNFCTVKPADYPQELFNKLFKGKFKEQAFQPTYVMTDDRQGDPDEMDDCDTTVTYEPLFTVKTNEGDWRTVVQAPEENYLQMVRLESCNRVGNSCFTDFRLPLGLQTLCTQKYNVWEFLVHDGKDGTEKVKVNLPMCCSCRYKRT
ncbi:hypothetical protein PYW07_001490 [Mythimna separata]|uniref:Spaetzle domain-containing protein n=1 Tax=Mythimna separata TaxID=271217 RepID=A0AAD8DWU8_MYTSE|nr:hypothetical protein PYW07_001490 [Mythimna separata]